MKHISLLLLATLFSLGAIKAQDGRDAYRFSKNDLTGTARSVSMGGAFGAVGADISGVAINPAGIGLYRSSEIVTTMNFQNTDVQTELNAGKINESKFKFNFDNLAFVSVFPLYNDVVPSINLGFSYNRLKNFDRKYSMAGDNLSSNSLSDYMAERATRNNVASEWLALKGVDHWDVWDNEDWLSVLGYNSFLINETPEGSGRYTSSTRYKNGSGGLPYYNNMFVQEKGSVNTYDFNIGTTFSDIVSWGITVSLTDINYHLYSEYKEDYLDVRGNKDYWGDYKLYNSRKTEGAGWQLKTGVIVSPFDGLRMGVSYHSPTWYNMTDYFYADLKHDLSDLVGNSNLMIDPEYASGKVQSYNGEEDGIFDYEMRTPDKWTFSLAGIIGKKAIVSADYELTNYANMKLHDSRGNTLDKNNDPNTIIKQNYKNASAVRLGLEYRITPQFSARVGYAWMESPVKSAAKDQNNGYEFATDKSAVTQYILDGSTNHITYGLGYKFTPSFYMDVAFVMRNQKDDLYTHAGGDRTSFKTNTFQGLLTLGYKFGLDR